MHFIRDRTLLLSKCYKICRKINYYIFLNIFLEHLFKIVPQSLHMFCYKITALVKARNPIL